MYELKRVEVRLRLKETMPLYSTEPIDSPNRALAVMAEAMRDLDREQICLINLDAKNRPINFNIISQGTMDSAPFSAQMAFRSAILSNSKSLILLHNHPSGICEASVEDWEVTRKIIEAGKIMDVPVLDHVIIGGTTGEIYSLREERPDLFSVRETEAKYHAATKALPGRKPLNERVKELSDQLEKGIIDLFHSDKFKEYLKFMGSFHSYSVNNSLLIAMARPDATRVASYQDWEKKYGRHVKKGEKGIPIFVPTPYKKKIEQAMRDQKGNPIIGGDGRPMTELVEKLVPHYKIGYVFDVNQTYGNPLPEICSPLHGDVNGYNNLMEAIEQVSPVPVNFENIQSGANGYYHNTEKRIVVQEGMSQGQTIKTTIHEITHAYIHDKDNGTEKDADRHLKEQQAEGVAFCVCSHYGIDTSDYSFGYILGWAKDKDPKDLKQCLQTIRDTSHTLISQIDGKLREQDREREKTVESHISFYVAECSEFHALGGVADTLSLKTACEQYQKMIENKNGMIPALGIQYHNNEDSVYDGTELDIMVGKIIDVESINEVSVFRESEEVKEAVEELKQAFPDARIRGGTEVLLQDKDIEKTISRHR